MIGVKDGAAVLEQYSTDWAVIAGKTIAVLADVLGNIAVDIQHIGSTAVIGLMAKPIIDIAVGVRCTQDVMDMRPEMERRGFIYRPRTAREGHVLFAIRDDSRKMDTHYIHVVTHGGDEWNRYIRFRDLLNSSPALRDEYQELKVSLAANFSDDRAEYTK